MYICIRNCNTLEFPHQITIRECSDSQTHIPLIAVMANISTLGTRVDISVILWGGQFIFLRSRQISLSVKMTMDLLHLRISVVRLSTVVYFDAGGKSESVEN